MPFLAPLAVPLIIAGTGVAVASHIQAGKEAERQGKSQRAIAEYNARIAELEATEKLDVASFEETKFRKAGERLKARQRVAFAKAGVEPVGTPMDVLEETAIQLETDALMIRRGGQIGARGLTSEAQLQRISGRSAILRGKARKRAANIRALGTGISGLGSAGFAQSQIG